MDLSIIILAYKSKTDLENLLPSVFSSQTKYSFEVILVDNGSYDGTFELVENFKKKHTNLFFIQNVNNGFSAGNNLGIKKAQGEYILLLNPDTKLSEETLEVMIDFMNERRDVGISGCKLIKKDGSLDKACRRRFPNPRSAFKRLFLRNDAEYNYSDINPDLSMEVESVVGAFLLIRKEVVQKIGLLDEDFFMYGEDLDWCFRAKEAGFKIWYYPKTTILHLKGESSKKARLKTLWAFHDSMWIFYKKHYLKKTSIWLSVAVFLGIYLRFIFKVIINFFKT